jgi:hypothetical protein
MDLLLRCFTGAIQAAALRPSTGSKLGVRCEARLQAAIHLRRVSKKQDSDLYEHKIKSNTGKDASEKLRRNCHRTAANRSFEVSISCHRSTFRQSSICIPNAGNDAAHLPLNDFHEVDLLRWKSCRDHHRSAILNDDFPL